MAAVLASGYNVLGSKTFCGFRMESPLPESTCRQDDGPGNCFRWDIVSGC